jgi:hypothetical protein
VRETGKPGNDASAVGNNASARGNDASERYELAGPETLSHDAIVRAVLRSLDTSRRTPPLAHIPTPIVSRTLRLLEQLRGERAFATWDEAELMEIPMLCARGSADVESLGVTPRRLEAVLGTA